MNYSPTIFLLVCVAPFQLIYGFQIQRSSITRKLLEDIRSAMNKCKEDLNLSNAAVKDMFGVETQDQKCFSGCVMEHMGFIKGNTHDWESHMKTMGKPYISNCKAKDNKDKCEMAYEIATCLKVEAAKFQTERESEEKKFKEDLNNAVNKCKEDSTISDEAVNIMLLKKNLSTRDEKCFAGCVLERMGVIKGNTYDWEWHMKTMRDEPAKQYANNCKGKVNEDKCELAYEIESCLKEEAAKEREMLR